MTNIPIVMVDHLTCFYIGLINNLLKYYLIVVVNYSQVNIWDSLKYSYHLPFPDYQSPDLQKIILVLLTLTQNLLPLYSHFIVPLSTPHYSHPIHYYKVFVLSKPSSSIFSINIYISYSSIITFLSLYSKYPFSFLSANNLLKNYSITAYTPYSPPNLWLNDTDFTFGSNSISFWSNHLFHHQLLYLPFLLL